MKMRKVLITSVGTGVGNAILTALGRSSNEYYVVGVNTEPFHSGVFRSDSSYLAPNSLHNPGEWLARIKEIIETEKPDIILPAKDGDLDVLSTRREEIESLGAPVVCTTKDIVDACYDKLLSQAFFKNLGLTYAMTADATDQVGVKKLVSSYSFPLILKPRRGTGTIGVKLIKSEEQLRTLTERMNKGDYIVQQFLPTVGKVHSLTTMTELVQDQEYSIQILFSNDGKELGHFSSINTLENGLPMAVRSVDDEVTRKAVAAVLESGVILSGPVNLQGRLVGDEIIFFEANCRFTGITGTRAGMNFNEVDLIWDSFVEHKVPAPLTAQAGQNAFRNLDDTFFSTEQLKELSDNLTLKPRG
jgi:carbamoyl-phosphate synthase large subunit